VLALIAGIKAVSGQRSAVSNLNPATPLRPSGFAGQASDRLLTICFLTSITGVLLHNLIDYNLQFVGIALPLWMMLGFLGTSGEGRTKSDLPERSLVVLMALVLLPATLLCSWQLLQFSLARRALIDGHTVEALQMLSSVHVPLFPRDDLLSKAGLELNAGRTAAAQSTLESYFGVNQEDARAWTMLGALQRQSGDSDGALWSYRRAFELGRWNDVGISLSLMTLLEHDSVDRNHMRQSVEELVNAFATAIDHNSHFIALSPNVEKLSSLLDLLARDYPADSARYRQLKLTSEQKAVEIRESTAARPQGYLW
jgi:hypothetical protein